MCVQINRKNIIITLNHQYLEFPLFTQTRFGIENVKVNTNNKTLFKRGNLLALQYKTFICASGNSTFFIVNIITVAPDKQRQHKEYSVKNNANPIAVS
jgi:hypothetical protein